MKNQFDRIHKDFIPQREAFFNKRPELRTRPLCGLKVLGDLRRQDTNSWVGGWVYDPKVGKTYNLDIELQRPGKPWAGPGPLGIGYAMQHTAITGAVDDVRLYRRALATDEIKSLYELGK